jgi:hypothetical protein
MLFQHRDLSIGKRRHMKALQVGTLYWLALVPIERAGDGPLLQYGMHVTRAFAVFRVRFDNLQVGRRGGLEESAAGVVVENTGIEKYRQSI